MSAQSFSHTSTSSKPLSLAADSKAKAEDAVKFVAQSRSVHIYRPDQQSSQYEASSPAVLKPISTTLQPPGTVVIMGWMDAPLRIVTKYAAPYAKLFPQATIIIKLSTGKSFMASKEAKEASLMKVVDVFENVSDKESGLLLHSCESCNLLNIILSLIIFQSLTVALTISLSCFVCRLERVSLLLEP